MQKIFALVRGEQLVVWQYARGRKFPRRPESIGAEVLPIERPKKTNREILMSVITDTYGRYRQG